MKWKCQHFDEIFVISFTRCCHCQIDNISISMYCSCEMKSNQAVCIRTHCDFMLLPNLPSQCEPVCPHIGAKTNKIVAISQTIISNVFSWMKMYEFCVRFHWSLFLRFELIYSSIGSDYGLAPTRWQAIIWTNDGKKTDAYMRHLPSNELMKSSQWKWIWNHCHLQNL